MTGGPTFQSPHGDSFFSDHNNEEGFAKGENRFNPLTGIRSFLTFGNG